MNTNARIFSEFRFCAGRFAAAELSPEAALPVQDRLFQYAAPADRVVYLPEGVVSIRENYACFSDADGRVELRRFHSVSQARIFAVQFARIIRSEVEENVESVCA